MSGRLNLNNEIPSGKKIGPAVPPKPKKSQPLVPKSYSLNNPSEPSFSTLLQGTNLEKGQQQQVLYSNLPVPRQAILSNATYCNIAPPQARPQNAKLSNIPPSIYSNLPSPNNRDNLYCNVGPYVNPKPGSLANRIHVNPPDDLPPPPPPPPTNELGEYAACIAANFPPPPEDLPPPPSPVSSSYSELRRATFQPDYSSQYAPSSQSSNYESIYEPINPRPASQMSSRSNYSLYAPYVSGSQTKQTGIRTGGQTAQGQVPSSSGGSSVKEAEVDALTDLLVQSLGTGADSDIYGLCAACGERVVGEGSGCTAMDQTYHISCFTCQHCAIQLQGKPFYALDGKPYCEEDYLNTLEKCSVCMKPILERILRATGKPYHPQCFSCIVCGKSLDGIPFTVDATNQIHCIEDFHKKFAPRCCVCKLPIMPEPGQDETVRVVALDRSFHVACYKCEDCGLVLSSEAEGRGCYPLDDHVLCKSCNANRVQALTSHMITEL